MLNIHQLSISFDNKTILSDISFELQKAKEIIQQLQQQNALLQSKLIEAQGKANALSSTDTNMNQVDLLKRLAKLEQEVYNK